MNDTMKLCASILMILSAIIVFAGGVWFLSYLTYKTNRDACAQMGGAMYEGDCIDKVSHQIIR